MSRHEFDPMIPDPYGRVRLINPFQWVRYTHLGWEFVAETRTGVSHRQEDPFVMGSVCKIEFGTQWVRRVKGGWELAFDEPIRSSGV